MTSRFHHTAVALVLFTSPLLGAAGDTKEACLEQLVRTQLAGTVYADFTLTRFTDPAIRAPHAANATFEGRGNGILVTGQMNVTFTFSPPHTTYHLDRSVTHHAPYYWCTFDASAVVNDEAAFVAIADGQVQRRVAGTNPLTRARASRPVRFPRI